MNVIVQLELQIAYYNVQYISQYAMGSLIKMEQMSFSESEKPSSMYQLLYQTSYNSIDITEVKKKKKKKKKTIKQLNIW